MDPLLTISDKVETLVFGHAWLEVSITVAIDVGAARSLGGREGGRRGMEGKKERDEEKGREGEEGEGRGRKREG